MNIAILSGALVSDVQTNTLSGGQRVSRFKLKTTELISTDGRVRQHSTEHYVEVWSAALQATLIPLMKIGDHIELRGSIESRIAERPGEPAQWMTAIVVRDEGGLIVGNTETGFAIAADAHDAAPHRTSGLELKSAFRDAETQPVRTCL